MKKWLYLPQAQDLYFQVIENEAYEGEMTLLVRNQENLQEIQFDISYEEGYTLSDLISQDLIKEIRSTADENLRTSLEIMENEISLSFSEPITIESTETEGTKANLFSTIGSKLPFKKKEDVTEELAEEEQPESVEEVMEPEEESYVPDYEEGEETEKELLLQPLEETEEPRIDQKATSDKKMEPNIPEENKQKIPSLQEYVSVEEAPVIKEIDQVIDQMDERVKNGLNHVLSEFNLSNPTTFIEKKQKEFIEKSFTKDFYSSLISSLVETKSNLLNTAILTLTEQYERQAKQSDPSALQKEIAAIKANVESRWQQELTKRIQAISGRHKQTIDQLRVKQEEELAQLKLKHSQEIAHHNNSYATEKEQLEKEIQEMIEQESQTNIQHFKKEATRKMELDNLQALETFKIAQFESMRKVVTETLTNAKKNEGNYLNALKKRLEDEQPTFEQKYSRWLEMQRAEEIKRKEQEELRLKEREIEVQEKKVALEEKTIQETVDSTKRMEKQNHELLVAQQAQLLETIKAFQINPPATLPQPTETSPIQQPKNTWWKGFFVATITFVTIGGIGTLLYTIHNVYAAQEQTTQVIQKQTSEMEQRLMGVIENQSTQTTQSTEETPPQTFEEYLIEDQYLEAAETFPEKKKDIVDYLLAQGDKSHLNEFLEAYPTTDKLQLLKVAILNGDSEEIFDLYRENDWDTLKKLSAVQKEKLALVLYQENYAVEANLLLED
ncbi:hypothetical protein [Enterococcus sp. 4E1_DIV0656]|uniref:hypothetical protein n=1 Tax=Enterococcus sp. 4E1_DIV0656 TaxID=1834180 RepID=UPI0011206081|nr:hypothetical protein [Enterococcus sp. 4E1_DIV0656]